MNPSVTPASISIDPTITEHIDKPPRAASPVSAETHTPPPIDLAAIDPTLNEFRYRPDSYEIEPPIAATRMTPEHDALMRRVRSRTFDSQRKGYDEIHALVRSLASGQRDTYNPQTELRISKEDAEALAQLVREPCDSDDRFEARAIVRRWLSPLPTEDAK